MILFNLAIEVIFISIVAVMV